MHLNFINAVRHQISNILSFIFILFFSYLTIRNMEQIIGAYGLFSFFLQLKYFLKI